MLARWILVFAALWIALPAQGADRARPDVVFIALDDLNDWITLLDDSAPIATPHLQRLARRGVVFTRAYCASPACNPSRTAVMTGLRPSSTGVYGNKSDWRRALPEAVTLSQHFRQHGYRAEGAGKIFHHHLAGAFHDEGSFDEFLSMPWPPDAPMPPEKLNRLPEYGSANTDWGAWPANEADALDVRTVDWCRRRWAAPRDQPLFLACGIFRPHMPFFVPERWFQHDPTESMVMPPTPGDDLADIPAGGLKLRANAARFFTGMMQSDARIPGSYRQAVRAYQASATFADAQVGRLLDAVDASPAGNNAIIVLWSDHGYQLGEKQCWEKFTLWEKANRVPLIVVAPGVAQAGRRCNQPVSLLDLYPTLIELCGLPPRDELEGRSLVPLLRVPESEWPHPALMTYQRGNHAVRDARWRYIRYADGTEELYNHDADPHEWNNLAALPEYDGVKRRLARHLPATDAPTVPDK